MCWFLVFMAQYFFWFVFFKSCNVFNSVCWFDLNTLVETVFLDVGVAATIIVSTTHGKHFTVIQLVVAELFKKIDLLVLLFL